MAIPALLQKNLKLPAIVAPMFLVSGPELVIAACKAGVIGTLPALNQRSTAGYEEWLVQLEERLGPDDAAHGVNLIVHKTNPRLAADLDVTVRHRVPLVITSLGAVRDVVDEIHSYGGLVFHDIVSLAQAKKAVAAGVDGLILVCAGAGGHGGTINPFALMHEVRDFFEGTVILSGCQSTGRDVASAMMMGADFSYMGTRFINTPESLAPPQYRQMILDSGASDITFTPAISGIPANFLNASLLACGLDPADLPDKPKTDVASEVGEARAKPWKQVWAAGHGVGAIDDVLPTADLVTRLRREFDAARAENMARFPAALVQG